MRVLGCLGLITAFTAGSAVTFTVMSLRPLADPVGRVFFDATRSEPSGPTFLEEFRSAMDVLTASIHTADTTRTWTHRDGRQIRATILSASPTTVTIKRENDGRVFTIQLDTLSIGDRAFVQRWLLEKKG